MIWNIIFLCFSLITVFIRVTYSFIEFNDDSLDSFSKLLLSSPERVARVFLCFKLFPQYFDQRKWRLCALSPDMLTSANSVYLFKSVPDLASYI